VAGMLDGFFAFVILDTRNNRHAPCTTQHRVSS
jgi:hypothetical protein